VGHRTHTISTFSSQKRQTTNTLLRSLLFPIFSPLIFFFPTLCLVYSLGLFFLLWKRANEQERRRELEYHPQLGALLFTWNSLVGRDLCVCVFLFCVWWKVCYGPPLSSSLVLLFQTHPEMSLLKQFNETLIFALFLLGKNGSL